MINAHSFHIPVMGIGFTIDTPIKVSRFGIDSVISLVDDILFEKLRKSYSEKFQFNYEAITNKTDDFRAKRITAYLNLINEIAKNKFEDLKSFANSKSSELKKYLNLLPENSSIKQNFNKQTDKINIATWAKENLTMGSIDVNIMTKLDKENYKNNKKLPIEYNDAHSALRGFANSDLESSLVLSAGMSPRLYSYIENFKDFYPNESGKIKKKIILKVSDYRSAMIQGKFLAKKGIWVSEYRIESGLNCGGHTFATEGLLLGPILRKFKNNRTNLSKEVNEIIRIALHNKNKQVPKKDLSLKVTVQGGVSTAEEHQFLMDNYDVDSVGWGTPFLLVPEASLVDKISFNKLKEAKSNDLYLSNVSPIGVPFNNLKNNTRDLKKEELIKKGTPGSNCYNKYLISNTEFTENKICTASRQYQKEKIKKLKEEKLPKEEYEKAFDKIVDKSCICVGLGTSALIENNIDTKELGGEVSICPGPNMSYFSKEMTLKNMVNHIYYR